MVSNYSINQKLGAAINRAYALTVIHESL